MLNHKHNVRKRTNSKILLIILCIFGLLFSYSCSCKNQVSDPNNIPLDNGIKTNNTPPPTPNNDPDKDLLNGDLSTTSTREIVVASAGDSIKTTSTIKFKNATAKLTAIADVDASANTTLALDDFDYSGTTLTFKKDTTDATKYDATTLAKVSWSGEGKKVKATFELTPTSANATLTKTTQEVEIEIGKVKEITLNDIKTDLKEIAGGTIVTRDNIFGFYQDNSLQDNKFTISYSDNSGQTSGNPLSSELDTRIKISDKMIYIKELIKVGNSSITEDKKTWSCKYKLSFGNSPYLECNLYTTDSLAIEFIATITSNRVFE